MVDELELGSDHTSCVIMGTLLSSSESQFLSLGIHLFAEKQKMWQCIQSENQRQQCKFSVNVSYFHSSLPLTQTVTCLPFPHHNLKHNLQTVVTVLEIQGAFSTHSHCPLLPRLSSITFGSLIHCFSISSWDVNYLAPIYYFLKHIYAR